MEQTTGTPPRTEIMSKNFVAKSFLRDRSGHQDFSSSVVPVLTREFMVSSKWCEGKAPVLCLMSSWEDLAMTTILIFFMMLVVVLRNLG